MFIPLYDKNPLRIIAFQLVTMVLIGLCIGTYWWQSSLAPQAETFASFAYGFIPAVFISSSIIPAEVNALPAELTLVSYMFMHGGWMHLLGNMLFLWVFGDNIEDSMGHARFVIFFVLCGMAAAFVHGVMEPTSEIPLVGASGAIAGILGAYLILHPRVKVLVLIFSRLPIRLPAYVLILLWILFQFFSVYFSAPQDNIAWWAHIGGFIAGVVLIIPMRYKSVALFDQGTEH